MTSYQAYGNNSRASPTPYTSAAPNLAGDGQFYPPGASSISLDDDSHASPFKYNKKGGDAAVDMRAITRTPSPTPSEAEELTRTSLFDWKAMAHWRYWIRREWLCECCFHCACLHPRRPSLGPSTSFSGDTYTGVADSLHDPLRWFGLHGIPVWTAHHCSFSGNTTLAPAIFFWLCYFLLAPLRVQHAITLALIVSCCPSGGGDSTSHAVAAASLVTISNTGCATPAALAVGIP